MITARPTFFPQRSGSLKVRREDRRLGLGTTNLTTKVRPRIVRRSACPRLLSVWLLLNLTFAFTTLLNAILPTQPFSTTSSFVFVRLLFLRVFSVNFSTKRCFVHFAITNTAMASSDDNVPPPAAPDAVGSNSSDAAANVPQSVDETGKESVPAAASSNTENKNTTTTSEETETTTPQEEDTPATESAGGDATAAPAPVPATTTATTTTTPAGTKTGYESEVVAVTEGETSDQPAAADAAAAKEQDIGPELVITLLLTTGARHPFKIDGKYLRGRSVNVENDDPFNMSVYTLKELIWREWRSGRIRTRQRNREYFSMG